MSKRLPENPDCLFTYGSLMCADIMARVSAWEGRGTAASLQGYRRCRVRRAGYPAIVADPMARVEGVLYRGIPGNAWHPLDRFEGKLYHRQEVAVNVSRDCVVTAWTYVISPDCIHRLEPGEWNFEDFLRNGKAAFLAECGFERET